MRTQPIRNAHAGTSLIQLAGLLILGFMLSAFAIDFSYYYGAQNQLQTAANSGALAAAQELYRSISPDTNERLDDARTQAEAVVSDNQDALTLEENDVIFGYIDPATRVYDPENFVTPSTNPDYALTGGYNAVRVAARRSDNSINGPLNTIMANMVGIHNFNAEASAVALVDQTVGSITNGGVRPIYSCEAQFNQTMLDGIPENNVVRIYGDHIEVDGVQNFAGCPAMGSGNWGFADLRNCNPDAVGQATTSDWFVNGYDGTVTLGQCYSTQTGNFISSISNQLDNLITEGTIFPIPLYDSWSGNGSNTSVNVSAFAGFRITKYKDTGAESSRYIEGHFARYNCTTSCTSGNNGNGNGTSPGGSVVKLRLAALQ